MRKPISPQSRKEREKKTLSLTLSSVSSYASRGPARPQRILYFVAGSECSRLSSCIFLSCCSREAKRRRRRKQRRAIFVGDDIVFGNAFALVLFRHSSGNGPRFRSVKRRGRVQHRVAGRRRGDLGVDPRHGARFGRGKTFFLLSSRRSTHLFYSRLSFSPPLLSCPPKKHNRSSASPAFLAPPKPPSSTSLSPPRPRPSRAAPSRTPRRPPRTLIPWRQRSPSTKPGWRRRSQRPRAPTTSPRGCFASSGTRGSAERAAKTKSCCCSRGRTICWTSRRRNCYKWS